MDFQESSKGGYIQDTFNSFDYDFLEEMNTHAELDDCYLSNEELKSFLAPSSEKWNDVSSRSFPTLFTIDQSKITQWDLAKREICHVRDSVKGLIQMDSGEISLEDIVMYTLGPSSTIGSFLRLELDLNEETYLKFLITILIQGAHRISCEELFFENGCLKEFCPHEPERL
jgi:hypothetical protein